MTGFLQPMALLALPLALLPFVLAWRGRRTGEPLRFSSLYLLERARRMPARWTPTRSRWVLLLRALVLALLVLTAARPVGCGRGEAAAHYPVVAVVAVDVSASVGQRDGGDEAWLSIRAWADTLLSWGSPDDRLALAAFADGVVGWWEGPPEALRVRLSRLEPSSRPSAWPAALGAIAGRIEEGTETYWLTDGSRGGVPIAVARDRPVFREGRHVVRSWEPPPEPNRVLASAEWLAAGSVQLSGSVWGPDAPSAAVVGRRAGERLLEVRPLPLDGGLSPTAWSTGDTATFAFREPDRFAADDRLYVAASRDGAGYRVARWSPPDSPPEPSTLFWEAALATTPRGVTVERFATLSELAAAGPDLALLPIRAYRPDEAALLSELAAGGSRLLFAPACPRPACVPDGDWLPGSDPAVPRVAWRLGDPARQTSLAPRPSGLEREGADGASRAGAASLPDHLLARSPIRGALSVAGGPEPGWTWDLMAGEPALWARGPVAVWLVPLGPPVTRLGTTPVFPLLADAVLAAWDPRWREAAAGLRPGDPLPVPASGATVTGPLHAGASARKWDVAPGGPPPRPAAPGLYRIEPRGAAAGRTAHAAVNLDPAEGDLRPIQDSAWRAAGLIPVDGPDWRSAVFPRRRGPELWPWALALGVLGLAAEAWLRRAR